MSFVAFLALTWYWPYTRASAMNIMKELVHNFTDNKQNELAVRFRCSQEEDVELGVGDVTDLLFQNRMPGVG